jgi:UDP-GlcNAc:undecaprenyl-phosphate GlcNAc-1-phosphate transferase
MIKFYFSIFLYPLLAILTILISNKLGLVDKPNSRKIHSKPTANTLGVSIYFFLIFLIFVNEFSNELETIIATGLFIIFIGFIDDRINLTPTTKLFFKSLPIIYLVLNGLQINDLGNYEFIDTIYLGKFSFAFSFLAILLLTNSFNYIDGTDGLLLGVAITALSYLVFLTGQFTGYTALLLYLIYILLISLIFNFLPSASKYKCFLGNVGSLFLGFFISFTIIYLYNYQKIHPAFLIWSCWYPVCDFLSVSLRRILKKKNITRPDKFHFHHYVLNFSKDDHYKTFLIINILNTLVICMGYLTAVYFGKIFSLILFVAILILFIFFRNIKLLFNKNMH